MRYTDGMSFLFIKKGERAYRKAMFTRVGENDYVTPLQNSDYAVHEDKIIKDRTDIFRERSLFEMVSFTIDCIMDDNMTTLKYSCREYILLVFTDKGKEDLEWHEKKFGLKFEVIE